MDASTDRCTAPPFKPDQTTQVPDPNPSGETKNDLPRKREKTYVPGSPKKAKKEASELVVGCTSAKERECTRERLKKYQQEMAGRVWIPDMWGQEGFLKDWKDCSVFDQSLVPNGLVSAREALVEECRRTVNTNWPLRVTKSF